MSFPQSLFDQSILFIARNVDMVEGFLGFPSQIGEKIFNAAIEQPRFFDDHAFADKALNVFSEAFGEELLYSLNMAGEHLCLNYHLEAILKFQDLRYLDVSHCGLGDDHEIVQRISHLNSLEHLCLKGNAITDAGIQKMTTPFRMFTCGPNNLSFVNLSGNPGVSLQCLKYFTQFPRLRKVFLSKGANSKTVSMKPWRLSEEARPVTIAIGTEGWAKSVIQAWKENNARRLKNQKPQKSSGFYRKNVDEHVDCVPRSKCNEAIVVAVKDDGVVTSHMQCSQSHGKGKQLQDTAGASDMSSIMDLYASCNSDKESLAHGLLDSLNALGSNDCASQGSQQSLQSCKSVTGQGGNVLNSRPTYSKSRMGHCEDVPTGSSRKSLSSSFKDSNGAGTRVPKRVKPLLNISAEIKGQIVGGKQHSSIVKNGNSCQGRKTHLAVDGKSNLAVLSKTWTTCKPLTKCSKKPCQELRPLKPNVQPSLFKSISSTVNCKNSDSQFKHNVASGDSCIIKPQKTVSNVVKAKENKAGNNLVKFVLRGNSELNTNRTDVGLKGSGTQHSFKKKKIYLLGRKRTFDNYLEGDMCVMDHKDPVNAESANDPETKSVKKFKSSFLDALDGY